MLMFVSKVFQECGVSSSGVSIGVVCFSMFFFFFPVLVVDNPLFRLLLEMEKEKNCGEYRDASRHVRICVLYA